MLFCFSFFSIREEEKKIVWKLLYKLVYMSCIYMYLSWSSLNKAKSEKRKARGKKKGLWEGKIILTKQPLDNRNLKFRLGAKVKLIPSLSHTLTIYPFLFSIWQKCPLALNKGYSFFFFFLLWVRGDAIALSDMGTIWNPLHALINDTYVCYLWFSIWKKEGKELTQTTLVKVGKFDHPKGWKMKIKVWGLTTALGDSIFTTSKEKIPLEPL